MTRLSGAGLRVGFANARELATLAYNRKVKVPTTEMHAVERYMLFARELGVEPGQEREFVLPRGEEQLAIGNWQWAIGNQRSAGYALCAFGDHRAAWTWTS